MKSPTTPVIVKDTEGNNVTIHVPVGSMDRPSEESQRIMKERQDSRGWKYPQSIFLTDDKSVAEDLCYCYDFFLGGHELEVKHYPPGDRRKATTTYFVTSRGYYHYVGA